MNFLDAVLRVERQTNLPIVYFGWVILVLPVDSSYSPISMNSAGDFSVAQLSMMTLLECRLLRASLRSVDEHKKITCLEMKY